MPSPRRSIQAIRLLDCFWKSTVRWPTHDLGDRHLVEPDGAGRVAEVGLGAGRQQPAQHLVGGPLHRGDRGDAEPLVDLGAAGVVDPGHDLLDPERLAGHPRGDDVGVVAAGHRGEGVGATDAGLLQDLLVEAEAGDLVAVEVGPQPAERVGLAVDDGDGVVAVLEAARERRADAATTHDHDVHGLTVAPVASRTVALPVVGVGDVSKRILLGRKLRSAQLGETLLPKRIALPVFASDALSSVAYAPDEIFIMLSLAGASTYVWSWKIGDRRRPGDGRGDRVVPADRARLPERRRRLRGRHRQPRPERRHDGRERAARRLRAHRRGVDLVGRAVRRRRRSRRSSTTRRRSPRSWCCC